MRTLTCCTPILTKWPSGLRPTHTRTCPTSPGQKVREFDYTVAEDAARDRHPAGANLADVTGHSAARRWRAHNDGCICGGCRYAAAHLDDDDDRGIGW